MADMGRLISEADQYGDERFAEGKASRDSEFADLQQRLDDAEHDASELSGALTDLQAKYDALLAEQEPGRALVLGMSAPATKWAERLAQVGPDGITARRIFVDPGSNNAVNASGQRTLIEQAVAAGMRPVVSYKGTPTVTACQAVRAYLDSLGVEVCATWHHEPNGDMTPQAFRDGSRVFVDNVKTARVAVGPILNGWLLDRKVDEFESWTNADLLNRWDFLGIDTYQADATSTTIPGDRIPLLVSWLDSKGHAGMPIVVGEFNGFTPDAITRSMQAFLDEPSVWIACVWNSGPTGLGTPLTDARLAAFVEAKRDPRVLR